MADGRRPKARVLLICNNAIELHMFYIHIIISVTFSQLKIKNVFEDCRASEKKIILFFSFYFLCFFNFLLLFSYSWQLNGRREMIKMR